MQRISFYKTQVQWNIINLNMKSQLWNWRTFKPTNNKYLILPIDPAKRYPTERTLLLQNSNA